MENPHPDDWFSVEMSCIGGQTDMKRLGERNKECLSEFSGDRVTAGGRQVFPTP